MTPLYYAVNNRDLSRKRKSRIIVLLLLSKIDYCRSLCDSMYYLAICDPSALLLSSRCDATSRSTNLPVYYNHSTVDYVNY